MSSFDSNGNYNKTNWKTGDKITADKLNKIEESLEIINNNDIERHKEADRRLDALEEQNEAIEDELNNKATKDEVEKINEITSDYAVYANTFYYGDWADAINNAISYAYANKIGTVMLPKGELTITSAIKLKTGIKLTGHSMYFTILKVDEGYSDYVITAVGGGNTSLSINRFSIENIKINLNQSQALGGVKLDWCYLAQLNNVEVANGTNKQGVLFYLSNVFNCLVTSCRAGGVEQNGTGFFITSSTPGENVTQVKITNSLAQYCDVGVHVNLLTGGSEISYENSGLGKNTTNMIIEGNVANVDVRLNHIEIAENGIVMGGSNVRCVNIELNDFFDVINAIIINDGTKYIDIKNNRFNGDANGGTAITLNGNVMNTVLYNNDILTNGYTELNVGSNIIKVLDETIATHDNNASFVTSISYKTAHYVFNNTSNVQIGTLPPSYHGHTVTFYFDDFSRFYPGDNLNIQRSIGLSENNITLRYNKTNNKWCEVCRYEKSMSNKPTTGNFSGGMIVWNNNRVNTSALYWVYIDNEWRDFNIISI